MTTTKLLQQLDTPCLLLDQDKLLNNIQRMRDKAKAHNVCLRPHMKTAKCMAIADLFADSETGKSPITVSTLQEAEYFADAGYNNILYAVGIEPGKFERAKRLYQKGIALKVVLDNIAVAKQLDGFAQAQDTSIQVMIEVDVDGHRAGIRPDDKELIPLARFLQQSNHIEFNGLMTHTGESYASANLEQAKQHAVQEQAGILQAKSILQQAGISVPRVSIGSTPTVVAADGFAGIDEIRPGVFVFYDLFQAQLGACQYSDIALTVLCSVVNHKPEYNRIILDAGALALSKDRSTAEQEHDFGYGQLLHVDGRDTGLVVKAVNQEHGIVDLPDTMSVSDFPIGSKLRVVPNHACMTAAAYPAYNVLVSDSESDELGIKCWQRCNGW